MIVAVGTEAIHDAVERSPRMHIREDRVVDAVHHFGIAHGVDLIADHWTPALASSA